MDKLDFIEKIKTMDKNNMDKSKILAWAMSLKGSSATKRPTKYKVGDVLMHSMFKHPYVLLEYKNDEWLCGLLTTEPTCTEILEKCNSRFFDGSYFTKTFFTSKEPEGSWGNVFDNTRQLNRVLISLKEIFGK